MWMQALVAAGVPHLGDAFPGDWADSALREANPGGFFEGPYVNGVFFGTNPAPDGTYFKPEDLAGKVAKVFVPGVLRTERAYIEGVIANVREWREYEASAQRLHELNKARRLEAAPESFVPDLVPPAVQWWVDNVSLMRDAATRGYPLQLQTYAQVLANPRDAIERALEGIGGGDLEQALAAVDPQQQTKTRIESDGVEPRVAAVFDEFYERVESGAEFDTPFIRRCSALMQELEPVLHQARVRNAVRQIDAGGPPPAAFLMAAAME